MIINARIDVTWEGVEKMQQGPNADWYMEFDNEIKDKLDATNVETITLDFYDEDDEELNIDWY